MKEAPKINFNVNVFRHGVNFDMPEDEIRQDEALVEDLGRFMMEDSMNKLVQSMKGLDGTPNDSEGLVNCFHKHGVNMRYLGKVLKNIHAQKKNLPIKEGEQLSEEEKLYYTGEFSHLKQILEKEIVLRSAKHVINGLLKEHCKSDLYLSKVISHLLNCLLAPFPQLDALDEGELHFEDSTL